MAGAGIAKKLVGTAVGVLAAGRSAAAHAGWWVRHQTSGAARDERRGP